MENIKAFDCTFWSTKGRVSCRPGGQEDKHSKNHQHPLNLSKATTTQPARLLGSGRTNSPLTPCSSSVIIGCGPCDVTVLDTICASAKAKIIITTGDYQRAAGCASRPSKTQLIFPTSNVSSSHRLIKSTKHLHLSVGLARFSMLNPQWDDKTQEVW